MRYLFSEPRRLEALANGKIRCYYDEQIESEPVITATDPSDAADDQPAAEEPETVTVYSYAVVDIDGVADKAAVVNALVRTRYSQDAVEALMRHKLAGDAGAEEEFEAFNTFAEACKAEAVRILGDTAE